MYCSIERVYLNKLTFNYAKWKEKKEFLKISTAMIKCKEKKHITLTLNSLKFTKYYGEGISHLSRDCAKGISRSALEFRGSSGLTVKSHCAFIIFQTKSLLEVPLVTHQTVIASANQPCVTMCEVGHSRKS